MGNIGHYLVQESRMLPINIPVYAPVLFEAQQKRANDYPKDKAIKKDYASWYIIFRQELFHKYGL